MCVCAYTASSKISFPRLGVAPGSFFQRLSPDDTALSESNRDMTHVENDMWCITVTMIQMHRVEIDSDMWYMIQVYGLEIDAKID